MTRSNSLKGAAGGLALIAAAACATAACGREGSLERPGPLFGLSRTDAQETHGGAQAAERQAQNTTGNTTSTSKTETKTTSDAQDDNAPPTARDIRDPSQRLTPLSASPVAGVPNPVGPPVSTQPPGA